MRYRLKALCFLVYEKRDNKKDKAERKHVK